MCFSATADLVGGAVLTGIGIDAVRHVDRRAGYLALAALPLLLAAHQVDEAFVWWGLQGHVPSAVGHVATWVYLLMAFVVLPVYVPVMVRALEPPGRRRTTMTGFVAAGAVVSAVLLAAMLIGPVSATLGDHHIGYAIGLHAGFLIVVAYIAVTCGALLFSGYRPLAIFGVVNLVAVAVLAHVTISGFASLWCGWAALTSGAIALNLRFGGAHRSLAHPGRIAT
ncbi:MAG TPA: DUF6629 family protein [Actinomycetes bacterium]